MAVNGSRNGNNDGRSSNDTRKACALVFFAENITVLQNFVAKFIYFYHLKFKHDSDDSTSSSHDAKSPAKNGTQPVSLIAGAQNDTVSCNWDDERFSKVYERPKTALPSAPPITSSVASGTAHGFDATGVSATSGSLTSAAITGKSKNAASDRETLTLSPPFSASTPVNGSSHGFWYQTLTVVGPFVVVSVLSYVLVKCMKNRCRLSSSEDRQDEIQLQPRTA